MPAFSGRGDRHGGLERGQRFHLFFGFVENLLFDRLAVGIEGLEHVGKPVGIHDIGGIEQFQCGVCVTEASCGIDAGRQLERDVRRLDRGADARHFDQGADAGPQLAAQSFHAVFDQDPVFAEQRHDIRHRSQRHEIEDILQLGRVAAQVVFPAVFDESMRQFERHADAGKMIQIRQFRIDFRIENRQRRGRGVARFVVVRDDHIDPARLRFFHCRIAVDPAVDGDQHLA